MGEIVEFPSNGHGAGGYLAVPGIGSRPRAGGDPGVVGPGAPHRGRLRPLRGRGLRRAGARPLPRLERPTRARRGRQADDGAQRRSGRQGHERRRRPPARTRLGHHRATSGSPASAWAAVSPSLLAADAPTRSRPACRSTGSSRGRTSSPTGRSSQAPVLGHFAENDSHLHAGEVGALQDTLQALGKDAEFIVHPGADHAFFNDTRPEVYDAGGRRPRPGPAPLVPFLKRRRQLTPAVSDPARDASTVDRYLELGLRLDRHVDGFVDAYYGPPALAARVEAEPPVAPAAPRGRRRRPARRPRRRRRRRRARRQPPPLAAGPGPRPRTPSPAKLAGESIGYADEVESCYGVRPPFPDDEAFAAAHRRLDEALPGTGPLASAYRLARGAGHPRREARGRHRSLADDFRERTQRAVRPARRRARRLGARPPTSRGRGSTTTSATCAAGSPSTPTCPCSRTSLGHLVAHEAYPGHHTEHSRKEAGLVRPGPRSRRRSSWSARRSACWPRAWPTWRSRSSPASARGRRRRAPAPARHPLRRRGRRRGERRPARRSTRCGPTSRGSSTTTARRSTT